MRKLIIRLGLAAMLLIGLISNSLADRPNPVSTCNIVNASINLSGGTLTYNAVGKGSTIILLHGLFADKEQWKRFMCQLSQSGYRAIALDLPGYGNSAGFTVEQYALERQVNLIHEWINSLKIDRFDLAGSSMGGAIASLYTHQYPKQVRSLALIGSPLGVIDWAKGVRNAIYQGVNPFIPITTEEFDLEISLLFVTPPQIPDAVKAAKVKDYLARNRHYQQIWDIVNLYDDVLCQSAPVPVPTLIIWGEADQIFDIRGANKLNRCIPHSKLIKLPNAGHLLLMENADAAALAYINFLKSEPRVKLDQKL
ncbi:alpha/beta hydrolase [Kovacikia minuta CCNUW1]|uniref:alpha/beta fold hydrolase n=1 Tax=Kovacikia minuta TaxID=2931930 RepID=UPI001CCBF57B|nr:alpha/beta hydrolase [Kovacikia minuta]UBF27216.1 alpha/beta hydrolase [Kovacikia minuta CCNUW1]